MLDVRYDFEFAYAYDADGKRFPRLTLTLANPIAGLDIDIDAYLDSGAERSLFDGRLAPAIAIDLLSGLTQQYSSTIGGDVEANLHVVRLIHGTLGSFDLEIGFSTRPISRNLLGRDFFNLASIGFRERHQALYFALET